MIQLSGLSFVSLGLFVLLTTFPGRGHIMEPSLLPVFGVPFAIALLLAVYAFAALMRSWRAVGLVTGVAVLGMGLGGCGAAMDLWGELAEHGVSTLRQVLVSGACVSSVALGAAVLKGWMAPER